MNRFGSLAVILLVGAESRYSELDYDYGLEYTYFDGFSHDRASYLPRRHPEITRQTNSNHRPPSLEYKTQSHYYPTQRGGYRFSNKTTQKGAYGQLVDKKQETPS